MASAKRRRSRTIVRDAGWAGLGLAGLAKIAFHVLPHGFPTPYYLALVGVGLVIAVASFVPRIAKWRRARKWRDDAKRTGRWPLGEPYRCVVTIPRRAKDVGGQLTIGADELRFAGRSTDAAIDSMILLDDVTMVRVQRSWIEIDSRDVTMQIKPRDYADRERLLFELAVRCNDAMERGLPSEPHAPAPATASADPDAIASGGSGLASALAGPMDRGNPAPPRKSGLGNGLFVGDGPCGGDGPLVGDGPCPEGPSPTLRSQVKRPLH